MNDIANPWSHAAGGPGLPLGSLAQRLGITLTTISPELTVGTMPVEGNTQPYGLLHGGATAALGETIGSFAAQAHGQATGRHAVGVEIAMTHHRAVRTGTVTGTARARHLGSRLATYELIVRDDSDRLVASGHLTCMLIEPHSTAAEAPSLAE